MVRANNGHSWETQDIVVPEYIAHGLVLLILLISFSPWLFLLNVPIAAWHVYRSVGLLLIAPWMKNA